MNIFRIGVRDQDTRQTYWDEMKDGHHVSVGWGAIGSLDVFAGLTKSTPQLRSIMKTSYPEAEDISIGRQIGALLRFVNEVQQGDIVVASDGQTALGIGVLDDGAYRYQTDLGWPHTKSVSWVWFGKWKLEGGWGRLQWVYPIKDLNLQAAIRERIPGDETYIQSANDNPADEASPTKIGGQGFGLSTVEKKAVEMHAMAEAMAEYTLEGWSVCDVSGDHSYDILCTQGGKKLHVEVKGTTGPGHSVILTSNEVEFAKSHSDEMDLYVLSEIKMSGKKGQRDPSGGKVTRLKSWKPGQGLKPTQYRYTMPAH
ncbi:MAG: DUF3883 domain-containing protein [Chloroflexi bacterium]|nr:DUF3883 domain-containing protein [Chloroflexota bacterium]